MSHPRLYTVFVVLLVVSGCSQPPPEPVDIEGVVQFTDRRSVPEMVINLHPEQTANQKNRPSGLVQKGGSFKVKCLPGSYRVTFSPIPSQAGVAQTPVAVPGQPASAGKLFPGDADYLSVSQTPLFIEVPVGGKTDIELTIRAKS